jgi:uncharacterized protein (TIGR02285 family)
MRAWLALLLLLPLSAPAESVTWLMFDAPPMFIRSGPLANQGSSEAVMRLLTSRLPAYQHRFRDSVIARAWHDIEHEDGICMVGVAKNPERERVAVFSRPIYSAAGNKLIALKEQGSRFAKVLDAAGRIDLDSLLRDPSLRGAYVPKRSYGASVTKFINNGTLDPVPNEYQLFNLLTHHRIDYFFGYNAEVNYYAKIYDVRESLTRIPVAGDDKRIEAHVACSNQPLGRAVIADTEKLLADPAFLASIQTARGAWETGE